MNIYFYETIRPTIDHELLELSNYDEKDIKRYCPNLNLITSEHKVKSGYCYNYALNNYKLCDIDENYDYLKSNYKKIQLHLIKKGDIAVFYDGDINDCYNIQHYAKIMKTNNTLPGTIIRSKWGRLGIWQGNIEDIPNIYGNKIVFWRKINKRKI